MKIRSMLMAASALAISLWPTVALAQVYSTSAALTGSSGSVSTVPPWTALRSTASATNPCSVAGPSLTYQYTNSTIIGLDGHISPDQPIVAYSTGSAVGGIIVPGGSILMHPGPNNECSMLRFTATVAGVYGVSAQYRGAYNNGGTSSGDGTIGMILKNGVAYSSTVDTKNGPGSIALKDVTLCPGDKIDFAVFMKANHGFDSTLLTGRINKVADTQACGGGPATGPILTFPDKDPTPNQSACCGPWWAGRIPEGLNPRFQGGANGPYAMDAVVPSSTDGAMKAWLNYLHAMDPSITTISINWKAADLGTAPAHLMSGPTLSGGVTTTWTWASGAVTSTTTGSFATGFPFAINTWYGFMTTITHNGDRASVYFKPECLTDVYYFRWNAVAARIASGTFDTAGAGAKPTRSAEIQVVPGRRITIPLRANSEATP